MICWDSQGRCAHQAWEVFGACYRTFTQHNHGRMILSVPLLPRLVGHQRTTALVAGKGTVTLRSAAGYTRPHFFPEPPSAGSTFVCSENKDVQGLEHVDLLHRQSSVEHRHGWKAVWKRSLVTPLHNHDSCLGLT